ncbi:MAG: ammonia channel protein, partial [Pseudomonadales bacterium]
ILTGVFAAPALGGFGEVENIALQVWIQTKGVLFTLVYSGVLSYLLLKLVDLVIGLRVNEEDETMGLDIALHDERGYNL